MDAGSVMDITKSKKKDEADDGVTHIRLVVSHLC
jgi:hypothetical protein